MKFRKINYNDFYNNYFEILDQLSDTEKNKITFNKFKNFIDNLNINHQIYVIEIDKKVVASGTIFIENKIIHGLKNVGHIEDVVVDKNVRGQGLGKKILNYLTNLAKCLNCYKVILNCNESNIEFYENCGYKKKEFQMVQYL